jgi:hypothetical protein
VCVKPSFLRSVDTNTVSKSAFTMWDSNFRVEQLHINGANPIDGCHGGQHTTKQTITTDKARREQQCRRDEEALPLC